MARLLSTLRVPELLEEEHDLLRELATEGARLVGGTPPRGPDAERMERAARFLFRRWLLEVLVLLRVRGALGYNEISRAMGGLAGESLAPKLRDLERAGLVERREEPGRPRRTTYRLTFTGRPVASAVYALTIGKAEHARAVRRGGLAFALSAPPHDPQEALGRFRHAAERLADLHARVPDREGLEPRLETARRFAATCVHKWHGTVLSALAGAAACTFGQLRAATGAGDQALANALRELVEVYGAVERVGVGRDASYRITPLGLYDLSLGAPILLMLPPSTNSEPLHGS